YFAIHWPSLIPNDKGAWDQMSETLSAPFIEDVLAGAAEWRIVSRYRLGQLLTESFQRRFFKAGGTGHTELRTTLGDIKELGLIFNTALCGSPSLSGSSSSKESADKAGGRMVLTNLWSDFDHKPKEGNFWKLDLPFEIVRDPCVSLFAAASLSANFPPVFSNAAVALDGKRFWVTDGGAVENRGLVSILLVLAEELENIQSKTVAKDKRWELADIRIIVADASAFQPDYKSDRGIGAMFGASEQLSNRLIKELELRVGDLHQKISGREKGIKIIYLPMPNAMRSSGTFGTHWMMPSAVTLRDPLKNNGRDPGVTLPGKEVREIIDALFSKEYSKCYIQKRWPKLAAQSFFEETKRPRTELDANLR
ncbi:MAG: hypothetical protein HY879_25125, partial [Deltaproteobacteria bacterium]|nr:hypothetical protein [Deltaproteobacteria bacterium]